MARPVLESERVVALDVLRGWALAGILLVNIQEHLHAPAHLTDSIVGLAVRLLANGKFYPLFTFLFAAGCAVQMRRFHASSVRPWPAFLRRAGFLYLAGAAFYVLVDHNPILMEYAVLGPLLWALLRLRARAIAACGVLSLALAVAVPLHQPPAEVRTASTIAMAPPDDRALAATGNTATGRETWYESRRARPYATWVALRASTYWHRWPTGNTLAHFLHLLAIGCAGVLILRAGLKAAIPDDLRLRRIGRWALLVGAPLVVGGAWAGGMFSAPEALGPARGIGLAFAVRTASLVGGPVLSLAYAASIVLALHRHAASVWQRRLAAAGRLAFTNFVMQSVVMVTFFYGLGAEGRIGQTVGILLVAAIWCGQLYASSWWTQRYRFGPIEWLWRTATYAEVQGWRVSMGEAPDPKVQLTYRAVSADAPRGSER